MFSVSRAGSCGIEHLNGALLALILYDAIARCTSRASASEIERVHGEYLVLICCDENYVSSR